MTAPEPKPNYFMTALKYVLLAGVLILVADILWVDTDFQLEADPVLMPVQQPTANSLTDPGL